MTYLCILFLPPLYFLTRKKWGGFCLNAVLYGLAWLCVITIVGIVIAPVFWLLSVGHAGFACRRELAAEHADLVATKLAQKMAETQKP